MLTAMHSGWCKVLKAVFASLLSEKHFSLHACTSYFVCNISRSYVPLVFFSCVLVQQEKVELCNLVEAVFGVRSDEWKFRRGWLLGAQCSFTTYLDCSKKYVMGFLPMCWVPKYGHQVLPKRVNTSKPSTVSESGSLLLKLWHWILEVTLRREEKKNSRSRHSRNECR